MDDAEMARIRKEGVLEVELVSDQMNLGVLMAVLLNIFPDKELSDFILTLHPSGVGVRMKLIK